MIYTHTLVLGSIYPYQKTQSKDYPYSEGNLCAPFLESGQEGYHPYPNIHLLETCRLIYQEASPILFSKNRIVFPILELTLKFFKTCLNTPERRSWVKSARISLETEDMSKEERNMVFDEESVKLREPSTDVDVDDLHSDSLDNEGLLDLEEALHQAFKHLLAEFIWPRKVSSLLEHLALERLDILLISAKCHTECCHLAGSALAAFTPGFAKGTPKIVNVVGFPLGYYDGTSRIGGTRSYELKDLCKECISEVIKDEMEKWTQLRNKALFSVAEGYRAVETVLKWAIEDEDEP